MGTQAPKPELAVSLGRLPLVVLAALAMGAAAPPAANPDTHSADRIRAHVEFLANDLLEGRETGSKGHAIAASYVAAQFTALGLKPGGANGSWFEQVPFRRAMHVGPPKIVLTVAGQRTPLRPGLDAGLRPSVFEKVRKITTPLVFVGYGISDARQGIDDYRGLNVVGKTVVALDGTPPGLPNEVASHLLYTKEDQAAAQGAAGFILIGRQGPLDDINRTALDWVDQSGNAGSSPRGLRIRMRVTDPIAQKLFARASMTFDQARERAASGARNIGFPLAGTISIDTESRWQDFSSPEVIGIVPGADPKVAAENVVLMAHLDHLGMDEAAKPGTDAIYNGALDNAAGVATMIEAARSFVQSGKAPRRSVMFIANTGEEEGLLGAAYFAAHPTVRGPVDAVVDLDMPLLLYDFTDIVAFGSDHSTLARGVGKAAASMGLTVSPDPMPAETLFVRSDHYPFARRGIPGVFLMTGWGNGGREVWTRFLADTYHTVKDDLSQPIRWQQGARFAELNYRIARTLADADERPLWYQGDYFGDTFAPGQPKARR
jgi:Zn-dependent M28 family amino/carboxypeptidase